MTIQNLIKEYELKLCEKWLLFFNQKTIHSLIRKMYDLRIGNNRSLVFAYRTELEDFIPCDNDKLIDVVSEFGVDKDNPIWVREFYHDNERLAVLWKDFIEYHNLFREGYLPIGFLGHPHSSSLLIGVKEVNSGEIWTEFGNTFNCIKLADNFEQFISLLEIEISEM